MNGGNTMRMPKFLSHLALLLAAAAGPAWAGGGTAEPRDPDYSLGTGMGGYEGIFTGSPGRGGGEGGKAGTHATDHD